MLKASELRESSKGRTSKNRELYKQLLKQCNDKIMRHNQRGFKSMIFKLNPISVGMPVYNSQHALLYILRKLQQGGFKVSVVDNASLFIDWCA